MFIRERLTTAILGLFAVTTDLHAQCESGTILGPPVAGADFGRSVATDGDVLVVGAPGLAQAMPYRFESGQWVADGPPLTGAVGSRFGFALTYVNGVLAIGAPDAAAGTTANVGTVSIYSRSGPGTWILTATLTPTTITTNADFGAAVDLDLGNRLVVGEPGFGSRRGRATIFESAGSGFVSVATYHEPALDTNAELGSAVAISGDSVCIGAPNADVAGAVNRGKAVFLRRQASGAWNSVGSYWYSSLSQACGYQVDLEGDRAVVAFRSINRVGAVLTWNGSAFQYTSEFEFAPDYNAVVNGIPRLADGRVFLTRPKATKNLLNTLHGTLRVYDIDPFTSQLVSPKDLWSLDELSEGFGASLTVSSTRIAIGAPQYWKSGSGFVGRVHTYDRTVNGWNWGTIGLPSVGSGFSAIESMGKGSLCANQPVALTMFSNYPNRPAFLVLGFSQVSIPFGGYFTLYPSPDLVLTGLSTNDYGSLEISAVVPPGIPSGSVLTFQYFLDLTSPTSPISPDLHQGIGVVGEFP